MVDETPLAVHLRAGAAHGHRGSHGGATTIKNPGVARGVLAASNGAAGSSGVLAPIKIWRRAAPRWWPAAATSHLARVALTKYPLVAVRPLDCQRQPGYGAILSYAACTGAAFRRFAAKAPIVMASMAARPELTQAPSCGLVLCCIWIF